MSGPPAAPPRRGRIRPVAEDDLPALVALHRRAFGPPPDPSAARRLEELFRQVFCRHAWNGKRPLRSLVHEDEGGRIVGCLGAMPRPMVLDDRPLTAAVSHHFMVDPARRAAPIALGLLRELFSGPQDLTVAEGNESSRRLWTALGGTAPVAFALHWVRPLRPAAHVLARARRRGLPGPVATFASGPAALADLALQKVPGSPLREHPAELEAHDLDPTTLGACIDRLGGRRRLRPCYDDRSLDWVLRTLTRWRGPDALHKAVLREGDRAVGWYLYHVRPDRVAEVVQVGADETTAPRVLDHLVEDARRHGATAITGRLDPALLPAMSERRCLLHRRPGSAWLLVHSRHEAVLSACHRGDAFLTHLEGEWWA